MSILFARFKAWIIGAGVIGFTLLAALAKILWLKAARDKAEVKAQDMKREADSARLDAKVAKHTRDEAATTEKDQSARRTDEEKSGRKHHLGRRWGSGESPD